MRPPVLRAPAFAFAILGVLVVASASRAERPPPELLRAAAAARTTAATLDPGRMGARELRRLPGVGERLSLAILRARRALPSGAPLILDDVGGIGPKTVARVDAWLAEEAARLSVSSAEP